MRWCMNLQKFLRRNFVEIDPHLPNTTMHKTPHARTHTHTHTERNRGNEDSKRGRGDAGSALRNRGRIWSETHFSTGSPRLVASSTDKQIVRFSFSGWKSFTDKFVGLAYQGKDIVFRCITEYSSLRAKITGLFLYEDFLKDDILACVETWEI